MEPAPTGSRVILVLQLLAFLCALGGVVVVSQWIVPNLAYAYASMGLEFPTFLQWLIRISGFWWVFTVLAIGLYLVLGRGRGAPVAERNRGIVVAASTLVAIAYLCAYAEQVTVAYSNTVSTAFLQVLDLRRQIDADSTRAAPAPADTTTRR